MHSYTYDMKAERGYGRGERWLQIKGRRNKRAIEYLRPERRDYGGGAAKGWRGDEGGKLRTNRTDYEIYA